NGNLNYSQFLREFGYTKRSALYPNAKQNPLETAIEFIKTLQRSFKQQDLTNNDSVPVKVFKQILNQYKCSLNEKEFYTLVSQLDTSNR
ncbi:unnamed protein product, partial [Adineta steineri]